MFLRISRAGLVALVTAGALILSACGGGDGGGSEEDQVARAANQHVRTLLRVISGAASGRDVLNVYAPECREGVDASEIDAGLALIRLFAPQLANAKIEEVDLGELKLEKVPDGYEVSPVDPAAMRIRADGKWQTVEEFFTGLGFDEDDGSPADIGTVLLVERDGKWYLGECSELQDFSGSSGDDDDTPSARVTVTVPGRQSTPSASRTGPGSSRGSPVPLGRPGRVEDLWEITVKAVDRDAWPKLQAESRFNEPPAADERILLIAVTAKNISSDQAPENIDVYGFKLVGSLNRLYDQFDEDTECGFVPDELDADLFPNGQADGNICFKVPAAESGFLLIWEDFFEDELTYFALE
jgi:hypothetical protein